MEPDARGPDLIESEITAAIKDMKNNKAEGIDGIPGEFWKNLGQEGMKVSIDLCRYMEERYLYVTGIRPSDFTNLGSDDTITEKGESSRLHGL